MGENSTSGLFDSDALRFSREHASVSLEGVEISPAGAGDTVAIGALLRDAGLPHADFPAHLTHVLVARGADGKVLGCVGAEVFGDVALLRSLVVSPTQRRHGLGAQLIAALERAAGFWGVREWWLLTTTAERFFAKRSFVVAAREDAPAAIRATAQFRELCSSAAVCMRRELRTE